MIKYNSLNVKLLNSQPNILGSGTAVLIISNKKNAKYYENGWVSWRFWPIIKRCYSNNLKKKQQQQKRRFLGMLLGVLSENL